MVGRPIYYVEADKHDQYAAVVATLCYSKKGYNISASLVVQVLPGGMRSAHRKTSY